MLKPRKAPRLVPMFGCVPHLPGYVRPLKAGRRCRVCNLGPRVGSSLVCMDCHRVAPDKVRSCEADVRKAEDPDQPGAKGPGRFIPRGAQREAKRAFSAKAASKPSLTRAERRALLRDGKASGLDPDQLQAWLDSLSAAAAKLA